jgi:hypothetical protein
MKVLLVTISGLVQEAAVELCKQLKLANCVPVCIAQTMLSIEERM